MLIHRLCATLVVLALTACAAPTASAPTPSAAPTVIAQSEPTRSPEVIANEIDTMVSKLADQGLFSGAVLVARDGAPLLSKGYGMADREQKIANTPQTKFRIASVTKQFTAMAIMLLQQQGKLDMQQSVCTYIADCPERWKGITLHHLLTHTSGLPDSENTALAEAKNMALLHAPGGQFEYSNTGYMLLGEVIEAVSGQPYEAFLQQQIFAPLQLSNTGVDHSQPDLAPGYTNRSSTRPVQEPLSSIAAAGLYSSVEDLYQWDQALYTDELAPQSVRDLIFRAHAQTSADGWSYGYGWRMTPPNQRHMQVHGGIGEGVRAMIRRYPDDHATIIVLANQGDVDQGQISEAIEKQLFKD